MTEKDIAWVAGLFEGEGTVSINRGRAAGIAIAMTDRDVLERVQAIFGGKICISYPAKGKWKECHKWYLSVAESEDFLLAIYPYLFSRRRERIDLWLAARQELVSGKRSSRAQEVIELSHRGLTQREIAAIVKVSQPYVSKVLSRG